MRRYLLLVSTCLLLWHERAWSQAPSFPYSSFLLGDSDSPPTSEGPIDFDGITTSVSRALTLQAGEAQVWVSVSAQKSTPMEQVLAVLGDTGIQASDTESQSGSYFSFRLTRSLAELPALLSALGKARTFAPPDIDVSFNASLKPRASAVEELRLTVVPQLVSEAYRKAQTIAGAANLTLGPLASLYDSIFGARPIIFLTDLNARSATLPIARLGVIVIVPGRAVPRGDLQAIFTVTARFAAH